MKFILVDEKNGDMFTEEFASKEVAIKTAEREWNGLSDYDKSKRTAFYVLESANPDEDAENHFDGSVIFTAK